jgi:peptide/nickel transport system permease protein
VQSAVIWLASLLGTLLAASFVTFAIVAVVPGDPALVLFRARYGEVALPSRAAVDAIRREAGFDRPVTVQWYKWMQRTVRGDMGTSFTRRRPVLPLLIERLPATLILSFGALALSLVLAVLLSIPAARSRAGTMVALGATQVGLSVPEYFLALALMLALAVRWRLFPVSGWGEVPAAVLPMAAMTIYPWAVYTRLLVAGMREARSADWFRTGRAKGISDRRLLYRHALPHAMIPVISLLGVGASGALSGTVVAEVIFAIPGAGQLLYEAVVARDIPVIQACLLVQVSLAVVVNSAADLLMRVANPLMRRPAQIDAPRH